MSGFEVAGILLGSIPLVIAALEHYKEGIDVVSDWKNYRSTLKSLKTKLSIQEELYRGTLQRLLQPDLSPVEIQSMFPEGVSHGRPTLWGTSMVDDKLRARLGSKYDIFMDVVLEMNKIMERLMEKLDIDLDGKPKSGTSNDSSLQNRFGWEWRRIRRTFGKTEREELVRKFERYNNDLASFVQNREILAPQSRTEGQATQIVRHLDKIRKEACRIHSILGSSWKCSCKHTAYLRLHHPAEVAVAPLSFGVTFPCGQPELTGDRVLWKHTLVCLSNRTVEPPDVSSHSTISAPNSPIANPPEVITTVNMTSAVQVTKQKKSKRVQFLGATKIVTRPAVEKPILLRDKRPHNSTTQSTNCVPHTQVPVSEVVDPVPISLCDALRVTATPLKNMGHLGNFPSMAPDTVESINARVDRASDSSHALCLDSLLSKTETSRSHGRLSDKERLDVAVKLSSTVLQLYESPWLNNIWSRKDIHFLLSENTGPNIDGPFVTALFQQQSNTADTRPPLTLSNSSLIESLVPSKTLFSLAIMLIELCLDKTLAEMRQRIPGAGTPTILDDYETANQQLNDVYQRSGSNYGDVVQRCLKCEFNITPQDKRLNFEAFRLLVYEGVVAPLEDNYKKYLIYRGDS